MKRIPESILQRLERNEEILRKFHEIELSILSVLNFKDFFVRLLTEISEKFGVPHTWVSIIETSAISTQIKSIMHADILKSSIAFISRSDFDRLIRAQDKSLLANTDIPAYRCLMPPDSDYDIGSLAITPISLDGEIIGSINQADRNVYRFEPGIDTSNLEHLGLKISLCMSNVCAHEQLTYMAFHDPLTGLLNRRVMEKILEREFDRSRRYQTNLSMVLVDLDNFKTINDTHGHDQGDRALIHIADCLMRHKRGSDVVARFAGDEFILILPSTTGGQADTLMKRIQADLKSRPLQILDTRVILRFSCGIASASDENINSASDLLKSADNKLYTAKQHKNNH